MRFYLWDPTTARYAAMGATKPERAVAETKCEQVLSGWTEPELALLFHVLRCAKWDSDRAKAVLQKHGWWLT